MLALWWEWGEFEESVKSQAPIAVSGLGGRASAQEYGQKRRSVARDADFNFNHAALEAIKPLFNLIPWELALWAHIWAENKNRQY